MDPLAAEIALAGLVGLLTTAIWGAVGAGFYWPVWVWYGLAVPIGAHALARFARSRRNRPRRAFVVHAATSSYVFLVLFLVWALSGGGAPFWPLWPLLVFLFLLAAHAVLAFGDRLPGLRRRAALERRVGELTRTRQGALDAQAAELRRIERDLHDGAQARLVALSMLLGRTEARLDDRPQEAELVRRARLEAGQAIAELRSLARGIAPPVLADRGLGAAVEGLGRRAPVPVRVDASLGPRRPPPMVETAAYFVVAEALTNVVKHACGAPARVRLEQADALLVEVSDSGPGGADPEGGGLRGLRHRVEALDGTLTVTSPPGTGTTILARLPCGP
jgi:signal transduction histidine kinase